MPANIANDMNAMLSDNPARVPEYTLNSPLYCPNYDVAVKTGTTDNTIDAWVVGYTPSIAIGTGMIDEQHGPIRTLQVVVADIEAAHAYLVAAGVDVTDIDDQPWGSFVHFADPDGNGWAVQQTQPRPSAG